MEYRVPYLNMTITVPVNLGPIVDERVREEVMATGAPALVVRVRQAVPNGTDEQGRPASSGDLTLARGAPGLQEHPLCRVWRGGVEEEGIPGEGPRAAATPPPHRRPQLPGQERRPEAGPRGLLGDAGRDLWRGRGEAALGQGFLKTWASAQGHPVEVAERYMLREGYSDQADARIVLVGSLLALERGQGTRMTDEERGSLRQLVDALRVRGRQRPAPGTAEEDGARQGEVAGLAVGEVPRAQGPGPSLTPVEPPPGLGLRPGEGADGTRPNGGEGWTPKVRATSLSLAGPDPPPPLC